MRIENVGRAGLLLAQGDGGRMQESGGGGCRMGGGAERCACVWEWDMADLFKEVYSLGAAWDWHNKGLGKGLSRGN